MARYLVYTCVTNDYDKVRKILSKQDPNIDFVCFTDKINKTMDLRKETGWVFLPLPNELKELDPRRQARMIKIGIYKYLKGYSGYLWIDAPILIIGNIGDFIREHPFSANCNLYVSKHYMRDCVYQEFAQVLRLNKDRSANVYNQYERYKKTGYPEHHGMAETSILYRNCADIVVQNHSVLWADEVMNYSYRDQLSFNWTAWTTKLPITYLNEDIYKRDTENETSRYFFLPWPKHNNPQVLDQLQARLKKNPLNNLVVVENKKPLIIPPKPKELTFEEEYKLFIDGLKKKKKRGRLQREKEPKQNSEQPISEEKPKRKRRRPKKEKGCRLIDSL